MHVDETREGEGEGEGSVTQIINPPPTSLKIPGCNVAEEWDSPV